MTNRPTNQPSGLQSRVHATKKPIQREIDKERVTECIRGMQLVSQGESRSDRNRDEPIVDCRQDAEQGRIHCHWLVVERGQLCHKAGAGMWVGKGSYEGGKGRSWARIIRN